MKSIRVAVAVALAAAIASGCGDDGTSPAPSPQLPDLVGTWEATSIVATNEADPSQSADLAGLGASAHAKFDPSGRVAFVATFRGETEVATGSVTVTDGTLHVTGDGTQPSQTLACGLSDELLTMTYGTREWDFDGDGTDEPARITMVLARCMDAFAVTGLSGDWQATTWELVSDANPLETVEVIALGDQATLRIGATGRYVMDVTPAGEATDTTNGLLQAVGEHLVASDDADPGSPSALGCEMTLMTMTVTYEDATYDFDEDGVADPASARVEWARI